MDNQLVSIITPMYKSAAFVGETIESVLAQTYRDWEMIIVDDCSPDGGAGISVVRKYAERDPRIILIESKENKGSSGARNIALRAARGRYVAFLDSDDLWHPDFIEKQLKFMQEKNAGMVFSSHRRIDENTREEILRPFIVPERVNYKMLLRANPMAPSTVMYDGKKCRKLFFNEDWKSMRDDYIYLLAMLKEIDWAYGTKELLVDCRLRKSSVTRNKRTVIYPQWRVLREVEKVPFFKSIYCMCCWAVISYFKFRK
jgi:glycosyltransferase involved in cell wall biosynthesis